MEFRIADTFTGSLARLTGAEQKAVKTTAFDLQLKGALGSRSSRSYPITAMGPNADVARWKEWVKGWVDRDAFPLVIEIK